MKNFVLTVYIYSMAFLLGALLIPPMAVLALATRGDPGRRTTGRLMRRYGRLIFRLMPIWNHKIEGTPPGDIGKNGYVVVANHQSTGDIFLLTNVSWDMRWVSKVELMKFVPILGLLLWLSGDIPVQRGNKASVIKMMERCRNTLKSGLSVMIFPEGTRTKAKKLGAFKDGAFHIAIETGRPILPLAISGTTDMWLRSSFSLGKASGTIRILPPISTEGMTKDDLPALKKKTRTAILDALVESGEKERDDDPQADAAC